MGQSLQQLERNILLDRDLRAIPGMAPSARAALRKVYAQRLNALDTAVTQAQHALQRQWSQPPLQELRAVGKTMRLYRGARRALERLDTAIEQAEKIEKRQARTPWLVMQEQEKTIGNDNTTQLG